MLASSHTTSICLPFGGLNVDSPPSSHHLCGNPEHEVNRVFRIRIRRKYHPIPSSNGAVRIFSVQSPTSNHFNLSTGRFYRKMHKHP
mmetsp:Transcript_6280/g.8659  ORF Transcript_6280/g.8659 Transcript_6280/m.8659 type:complete len:87 (-) Transcript_6280:107-367(-)